MVIWQPHPGPQTAFLRSDVDEVLYGGAAGGGKTDALIVDAVRGYLMPSYRGLLLRRTFPELERSIIPRTRELYPFFGGRYNDQKKRWVFPSGAVVEMGYLDRDADVYKYHSAEYQFIGFDELTHFTEFQFDYMKSRLRSGRVKMPCRMRAASNPGGVGHVWVKSKFIDPMPAREIAFFKKV